MESSDPPEFPDFEVESLDDAEKILAVFKKIEDYFDSIETGEILPTATYEVLVKALDWFPYALRRLEEGKEKFTDDPETKEIIQDALDILNTIHPTIEPTINDSDELREREGEVNGS
ncbi:uncharacterized protein F4807DRAFT_460573 [Annulohypoxylon truncatum]|uniref:uncharacterized protein n=1 Tax=Annulohypoxylon truncatum TaxID=327061 RepID=UPI0020073E16|nr:uncharacterized protein F4807DRAFT_460573 [Annulohypoxylon truncatum]KAI1209357.1 hypothetical protein F4807DRAFT_460573 [Annulohypoxylon truncatum]